MPIYQYDCGCGFFKEEWITKFEAPKVKCKCGKQMRRVWGSNFILKGDGWAATGYVKESEIADYELGKVDKSEWE